MHENGLPPWVVDGGSIEMTKVVTPPKPDPKPLYTDGLYVYRPKGGEPWVSHFYNGGQDICNKLGQLMDTAYKCDVDGLPTTSGGFQTVSFDWYCQNAYQRGTEISGRWAPRAQAAGCAASMLMVPLMGLAMLL